jgi:hypothetical protein
MTIEAQRPGALPVSLRDVVDRFLADLRCVDTVEMAAHIDSPLIGKLLEMVLERRRVARLRQGATGRDPKTLN